MIICIVVGGLLLCGLCSYLNSINCECNKVCKDFGSPIKYCYGEYCYCFGTLFTKIKLISICIHDIWCDYWCPLQLEDSNYVHYGSVKEPSTTRVIKKINFEEKNLITKIPEEDTCSICLEVIDRNNLVATHCDHHYCRECIQEYLNANNNDNCPLCRVSIGDTLYIESPA